MKRTVDPILEIVFTGVISCVLFEILKSLFIYAKNKCSEASLPFSVSGYWGTFHKQGGYSAYELLNLKVQGDVIKLKIYQLTEDQRFHIYKGCGFIRGDKISLVYREASSSRSNMTGTMNLKIQNLSEHDLMLSGKYTEFSKNEKECVSYAYELKAVKPSPFESMCIQLSLKKRIKRMMISEEFKDASRESV